MARKMTLIMYVRLACFWWACLCVGVGDVRSGYIYVEIIVQIYFLCASGDMGIIWFYTFEKKMSPSRENVYVCTPTRRQLAARNTCYNNHPLLSVSVDIPNLFKISRGRVLHHSSKNVFS